LQEVKLEPDEINTYLTGLSSSLLVHKIKASQLLVRPEISLHGIISNSALLKYLTSSFSAEAMEQAEIEVKYEVYLEKEEEMVKKMSTLENQVIPSNFNYDKIVSLSNESRQKFNKIKPQTLGQASRISGVNPSDVQILMVYMGR
jgi:tRNA uridine 5-carboxymethylaminomethyl modification enzyme